MLDGVLLKSFDGDCSSSDVSLFSCTLPVWIWKLTLRGNEILFAVDVERLPPFFYECLLGCATACFFCFVDLGAVHDRDCGGLGELWAWGGWFEAEVCSCSILLVVETPADLQQHVLLLSSFFPWVNLPSRYPTTLLYTCHFKLVWLSFLSLATFVPLFQLIFYCKA